MKQCIYCENLARIKVCKDIECRRRSKREERKRNFKNRKDGVFLNAKKRYYSDDLKHIISYMMQHSKARAKKYSLDYDLDKDFLYKLFTLQDNKCALTKISFNYEINESTAKRHKRPFAASLDRIDSSLGYVKSNIRLVCIIVNFALSEFGDLFFDKMCHSYVENKEDNYG